MELLIVIYLLIIVIVPFWVYSDASRRHSESQSIGCLWALMVVALGPLALIAYLLVRPPAPDEIERRSTPAPQRTCRSCGAPNPGTSAFCGSCGAWFER